MLALSEAIETVVAGLNLNRSVIAPSEVVLHGPLRIMRDKGLRRRARLQEIFAYGAEPNDTVRALREYAPPERFALEPFLAPDEDAEATKAAYKALGFRLIAREELFACRLGEHRADDGQWRIQRVTTPEAARDVGRQVYRNVNRRMLPEDFGSQTPSIRWYWAEADGVAVAAARSLTPRPGMTCLHDVVTLPAYRRRGIAAALLTHILADDARFGAQWSVLLASKAGSMLYPHLGYQRCGVLQIYSQTNADDA